jgi:hypothetical protein
MGGDSIPNFPLFNDFHPHEQLFDYSNPEMPVDNRFLLNTLLPPAIMWAT